MNDNMSASNVQTFELALIQILLPLIKNVIHEELLSLSLYHEIFPNSNMDKQSHNINIEMITIKQCRELLPGISYYKIKELINRGDVKYFRTGQGKHGKILVYKQSFLEYFTEKGGIA